MFQGPDEDAHFDYALSLYAAGGLLNARDRTPDPYPQELTSSPYVAYLEMRTGFDNVRETTEVKAPPNYGSAAFYRSIDNGAPSVRSRGRWGPSQLAANPFAYYLLAAIWMWLAHFVAGDSVGLFFAARILSCALLGCSILLTYGILRRLQRPLVQRLAIVLIVGIFPLTSFVSSYVQPENLALALTCAAIYLSLRLRDESHRWLLVGGLGVALGLLLVTKPQYWICAVIASGLFLQGTWWKALRSNQEKALSLLTLVLPAAALQGINEWVIWGAKVEVLRSANSKYGNSTAALTSALHAGPMHAVTYVITYLIQGVLDVFVGGQTVVTFWGNYGWIDTLLRLPVWVVVLRGLVILVLLVLATARLTYLGRRLVGAIAGMRWAEARETLTANPLVSSYVAFTVLILAIIVVAGSSFGSQGRYWLPVLPGVFYTALIWAPQALKQAHVQVIASNGLVAVMVGYAVVTSYLSIGTVESRYYGNGRLVASVAPSDFAPGSGAEGAITYVVSSDRDFFANGRLWPPFEQPVPDDGTVAVGGWARGANGQAADAVFIVVDGTRYYQAVVGDDTPRAKAAPPPAARDGFDTIFQVPDLSLGEHQLTIAVASAGRISQVPGDAVAFKVVPPNEVTR